MAKCLSWIAPLVCMLGLLVGCGGPKVDGMGHVIPVEQAIQMARDGSPLVEVTRTEKYTSPPTVHVIHGKDRDGRQLLVFVYTTVIRYVYADALIPLERALAVAREAGFPVDAVRRTGLRAMDGMLDGRQSPVFWRLETNAGWICIDAETEAVLKRLDAE